MGSVESHDQSIESRDYIVESRDHSRNRKMEMVHVVGGVDAEINGIKWKELVNI